MALKIDVSQYELQRLTARFTNMSKDLMPAVKKSLATDAGGIMVDWIKYGLLSGRVLKVRSGALRDSIKLRATTAGIQIYQDETEAPYGRFHEFGVMHSWEIRPRNPQGALRFRVGGKDVFAKRVIHPGLKSRPFLFRGVREKLGPATIALEKAMARALRGR